jgi:transcription termination/antitermination protein NusA
MRYDILEALTQITREKNIDMSFVLETLEASLLLAAKKKFDYIDNIKVDINVKAGDIRMYALKNVVKKVSDAKMEISLAEAKGVDKEAEVGDEIEINIGFEEFGRNAILAAKQILIQRVREAEKEKVYEQYKDKVGELVTGTVQQIDKGNIIVNLGRTEAIVPHKEQIPKEKYRQGDRIRAYILDVQKTNKGPEITLSRATPGLLARLFELEVPEIFEKIIEIKAVAREPGERSKIAVSSADGRIDPVGACVGVRGVRVQSIVRELSNERIDVIPWNPDPEAFVSRALAPAKIVRIDMSEKRGEKEMTVVVEDDKLSLAIGKAGQNARLTAKLTGWKINIVGETEYRSRRKVEEGLKVYVTELAGVGEKLKQKLAENGIETIQDLVHKSIEELTQIEGIGEKKAASILKAAEEYLSTSSVTEEKQEGRKPFEAEKEN